jgi:hypothetical protein
MLTLNVTMACVILALRLLSCQLSILSVLLKMHAGALVGAKC